MAPKTPISLMHGSSANDLIRKESMSIDEETGEVTKAEQRTPLMRACNVPGKVTGLRGYSGAQASLECARALLAAVSESGRVKHEDLGARPSLAGTAERLSSRASSRGRGATRAAGTGRWPRRRFPSAWRARAIESRN